MSANSLAFLIPVITIFISVITSVIIATMQNRAEINRIYKELEHKYAKSLFDIRVETYPQLHNLLADI